MQSGTPPQRRELAYRLSNPNYTIYHRAALGGLAATVRAWEKDKDLKPAGIEFELKPDGVRLCWSEELSEQQALRLILCASFKLTPGKGVGGGMIDLPGHGIKNEEDGLRLAVHTGIMGTFLQHNQVRKAETAPRLISLKTADQDVPDLLTYKALDWYAHQMAKTTELLNDSPAGRFPTIARIPSSVLPGAMKGMVEINASPEDAILMLFLMVGCAVYQLRPRVYKEKAQFAVVVPDVIDLVQFAKELRSLAASGGEFVKERFRNKFLNRVVGGAEEAALSFLVDTQVRRAAGEEAGVAGCLVVGMGRVSWDKNQNNRSMVFKVSARHEEMNVFKAAKRNLFNPVIKKSKKGESYVLISSPIPEFIAANLAAGRHWCANFRALVEDKKDFGYRIGEWKGLVAMREQVRNVDDQTIIKAFHEAWFKTMSNLGRRDKKRDADAGVSIQNRKERIRNEILRAKTADALASWFLRFCTDATEGDSLDILKDPEEARRVREFIFNARNFERFQNLCLFALVSYVSEKKGSNTKGERK